MTSISSGPGVLMDVWLQGSLRAFRPFPFKNLRGLQSSLLWRCAQLAIRKNDEILRLSLENTGALKRKNFQGRSGPQMWLPVAVLNSPGHPGPWNYLRRPIVEDWYFLAFFLASLVVLGLLETTCC